MRVKNESTRQRHMAMLQMIKMGMEKKEVAEIFEVKEASLSVLANQVKRETKEKYEDNKYLFRSKEEELKDIETLIKSKELAIEKLHERLLFYQSGWEEVKMVESSEPIRERNEKGEEIGEVIGMRTVLVRRETTTKFSASSEIAFINQIREMEKDIAELKGLIQYRFVIDQNVNIEGHFTFRETLTIQERETLQRRIERRLSYVRGELSEKGLESKPRLEKE